MSNRNSIEIRGNGRRRIRDRLIGLFSMSPVLQHEHDGQPHHGSAVALPQSEAAKAEERLRKENNLVEITAKDGTRLGVSVLPLYGRTHLVIHDLDEYPRFYGPTSLPPVDDDWLIRVAALGAGSGSDYHWDTPQYRALCAERGLDPDHHRPRFRPEYAEAGEALVRIVNRTATMPSYGAMNFIMDLVEAIRIDDSRNPVRLEDLRDRFAHHRETNDDLADEILKLVEGVPGLRTAIS